MDLVPVPDDPNKYCKKPCKKYYANTKSYSNHLRSMHNLMKKPHPKPNRNIIPDISNSNKHCASCNISYASRTGYLLHLKRVHNMTLDASMPRQPIKINHHIKPGLNDPTNFLSHANVLTSVKVVTVSTYASIIIFLPSRKEMWKLILSLISMIQITTANHANVPFILGWNYIKNLRDIHRN
jgi:hypothetical protein